jgi:hypothetical protein
MGNGGYNVGHYDIRLSFNPATHAIAATTTIRARATQNLSRFDLDFMGPLKISRLTINGHLPRSPAWARRSWSSRRATGCGRVAPSWSP